MLLVQLILWGLAACAFARVEVHGHRGARARFPENTLPAFEYAVAIGVDYLEMDLQVTSDRHLVVNHDSSINPAICLDPDGHRSGSRPIFRMTLAEVKRWDCGSRRNPLFPNQQLVPGTRIPTLDEVFELLAASPLPQARTVRLNIEMKSTGVFTHETVRPAEFAALVMDCIRRHGMESRVLLQSFDYRTLVAARKIDPTIPISALNVNPFRRLVKTADELNATFVAPRSNMISTRTIKKLHAHGVKVVPWTANTPAAWKQLLGEHVDAIISDDPEALIRYLGNQ